MSAADKSPPLHCAISPLIVMQDGPRTTLLRRGTNETRALRDNATDDEVRAALRLWEAEIAAATPTTFVENPPGMPPMSPDGAVIPSPFNLPRGPRSKA